MKTAPPFSTEAGRLPDSAADGAIAAVVIVERVKVRSVLAGKPTSKPPAAQRTVGGFPFTYVISDS
jgi:hypothetical protein